jgi:hypothetical protein
LKQLELRYQELNGKPVAYHSATEFRIQIGKGYKGSYKNRMTIVGNLGQAVMWYNSLNIGNGYKKRLLMGNKSLAMASSATPEHRGCSYNW